jgi:hypothetical protein
MQEASSAVADATRVVTKPDRVKRCLPFLECPPSIPASPCFHPVAAFRSEQDPEVNQHQSEETIDLEKKGGA